MICLHATVGSFHSALSWLVSPVSKVSTHYLLSKSGRVLRLVAEDRAAWHAGASAWFDLDSTDIMRESLGIELENNNSGNDPYPPAQMAALIELCRALVGRYRIAPDMIVRHLDIAIPRARKTDPAGFPIIEFKQALFSVPAAKAYKVRGVPVYQRSDRSGPLWGHLVQGEVIAIDDPENGHLADDRGFVKIDPDILESLV